MSGRTSPQPDVVLIVLDTLRADRMSCYGYPRETTPRIDAYAEGGTLFERAIVPGQWTIPSHASIFTGEYPTTHMTTQIYDRLGDGIVTLADLLNRSGYKTVGFCNNPLLGVVDNELDRGFEEFYNYGGAVPNYPVVTSRRTDRPDIKWTWRRLLARLLEVYTRVMRRVTAPLQNQFAHNSLLLRIAMHPLVVPLWQESLNFKGNTKRSLRDVVGYLRAHRRTEPRRPLFTFVNLMETHLPYRPPARFIHKFAPYYADDAEARDFMRRYNLEHYRWMTPLTEPLGHLADRTLNDLYDAEVAYEDRLLRRLLKDLSKPAVRDNTLVVITSDHGEGLNNHDFVGHSLVAYDDLVRVPLIVRYPKQYPAGRRISSPVSTRRIFHSVLDAAGIPSNGAGESDRALMDVERLSLTQSLDGHSSVDVERENGAVEGVIFAEAYAPDTLLALMENQNRDAIETFRCRSMRRAAYRGRYKLITVDDEPDELFDVVDDPSETRNLLAEQPGPATQLQNALTAFVQESEARRPANWEKARKLSLDDEEITERLRALGYIE